MYSVGNAAAMSITRAYGDLKKKGNDMSFWVFCVYITKTQCVLRILFRLFFCLEKYTVRSRLTCRGHETPSSVVTRLGLRDKGIHGKYVSTGIQPLVRKTLDTGAEYT